MQIKSPMFGSAEIAEDKIIEFPMGLPGFEGYPMWQAPNKISGGGLAPRSEGFTQPRSYVEVDSIDEALTTAEANGGRVLMAKAPISDTSWWAIVEDPFGNHIGLYEGRTDTAGG